MRLTFCSVFIASFIAAALPARAADAPDLTGTWKGTVEQAVMVGDTPYRTADPARKVTFADEPIEFTFIVGEQRGARFGGEMSGRGKSETFIGTFHADGKTGVMLDDDGRYDFTLRDANTIDLCYDHTKPGSKVIACWTITRQP